MASFRPPTPYFPGGGVLCRWAYNRLRLQWLPSVWVCAYFLLPWALFSAPQGLGCSVAPRLSEGSNQQELQQHWLPVRSGRKLTRVPGIENTRKK